MASDRPTKPATIVALTAGAILAVGAAGYSIMNALTPPAPASRPAPVAPPAATAARNGAPAGANQPGAQPGNPQTTGPATAASGAAGGTASGAPGQAGTAPGAATEAPRLTASAEGILAPDANPFVPLPILPGQGQPKSTDRPAPTVAQAPAPAPRGGNPTFVREGAGPLPNVGGSMPPMTVQPFQAEVRPAPPAKEPELVGTLLGGRPSAVFKGAKQTRIVPIGGMIEGWKVVAVRHGIVEVRNNGRNVLLEVGGGHRAGTIEEAGPTDRSEAAQDVPQIAEETPFRRYISHRPLVTADNAGASSGATDPAITSTAGQPSGAQLSTGGAAPGSQAAASQSAAPGKDTSTGSAPHALAPGDTPFSAAARVPADGTDIGSPADNHVVLTSLRSLRKTQGTGSAANPDGDGTAVSAEPLPRTGTENLPTPFSAPRPADPITIVPEPAHKAQQARRPKVYRRRHKVTVPVPSRGSVPTTDVRSDPTVPGETPFSAAARRTPQTPR